MYNYDYKIKYNLVVESNTQYKKDILECFNLTKNDFNKISKIQEEIFNKFKEQYSFISVMNFIQKNQKLIPCEIPIQTCFILCFSHDYFYLFHRCLRDLNELNEISKTNFQDMISLIKKNS